MSSMRTLASALLFLVGAALVSGPAAAATPTTLSGVVRDQLGRALPGAEILLLPPEGQARTPLHALTNAEGRFLIDSVSPGVYRVAAIKSGYVAALGRVNTFLKASVDLVLRPVPAPGAPGSQNVQDDLSWTLRVPPRSVLKKIEAEALIASLETPAPKAAQRRMPDSIRGEVEHVVALGAWRSGSAGSSSALTGNETHMQFGGSLGQRGAIRVEGSHGSLDSSSGAAAGTISRAASDLDVDVFYETGDDGRLGMRAFFSSGMLEVGELPGLRGAARQGQRSWGYEGQWKKQVGGSSRVALQVGFHDASVDVDRGSNVTWDDAFRDASNRAVGAEGQFESLARDGHLMRFGVRAQLMSLSAPTARIARSGAGFVLEGTTGWSVLLDAEDQWTVGGPWAVTYGMALRQGFDDTFTTTAVPRIGASWGGPRFKANAQLSYLAATGLTREGLAATELASRMPVGYLVELEAPVTRTTSVRGTVAYVPLRANVWTGASSAPDLQDLYVSDGSTSDRFVALAFERVAADATVSFRVAQGLSEGALAPAFDGEVPVLILSERMLRYESLRFGMEAPRVGSSLTIEYRAIHEQPDAFTGAADESLQTVELGFAQQLVRLAGGRASCRLLLTARTALGSPSESAATASDGQRFAALYQRVGAGVSLAF